MNTQRTKNIRGRRVGGGGKQEKSGETRWQSTCNTLLDVMHILDLQMSVHQFIHMQMIE